MVSLNYPKPNQRVCLHFHWTDHLSLSTAKWYALAEFYKELDLSKYKLDDYDNFSIMILIHNKLVERRGDKLIHVNYLLTPYLPVKVEDYNEIPSMYSLVMKSFILRQAIIQDKFKDKKIVIPNKEIWDCIELDTFTLEFDLQILQAYDFLESWKEGRKNTTFILKKSISDMLSDSFPDELDYIQELTASLLPFPTKEINSKITRLAFESETRVKYLIDNFEQVLNTIKNDVSELIDFNSIKELKQKYEEVLGCIERLKIHNKIFSSTFQLLSANQE